MKTFFTVVGLFLYVSALFGCLGAKTSIHEIQSSITAVIGTIFLVGAALMESIQKFRAWLDQRIMVISPRQPDTHILCPECREPASKLARKCPHCGCDLLLQDPTEPAIRATR